MRPLPVQTAIALLVLILAAVSLVGRFGDRIFEEPIRLPDTSGVSDICLGFSMSDREVIGIACGASFAELLSTAIRQLNLPKECAALSPSETAASGSLLKLELTGSQCRIAAVDSLPAPQRLVCGGAIDLNRDAATDIELLPGIGPKKARAIVDSRIKEGRFESVEELVRIKGIGEKTVQRIRPWVEQPE